MSRTPKYDKAALLAFYATHTQAETCKQFGCSAGTIVRAARAAEARKRRRPMGTTAFDEIAAERGVKVSALKHAVIVALSNEPTLIRNLIDEVA
jgi:hypothetical protein